MKRTSSSRAARRAPAAAPDHLAAMLRVLRHFRIARHALADAEPLPPSPTPAPAVPRL